MPGKTTPGWGEPFLPRFMLQIVGPGCVCGWPREALCSAWGGCARGWGGDGRERSKEEGKKKGLKK